MPRAGAHVLRVLDALRLALEELLSADAQKLFEERSVARVGLVRGEDDVPEERDEARGGGDGVVKQHAAEEPVGYPV